MKETIKFEHEVEIIHEPSGKYLTYTFTADEFTDSDDIFKQFVHDLSIIIQDVEQITVIEEEEEDSLLKTGEK
jgi:hypothetical protein